MRGRPSSYWRNCGPRAVPSRVPLGTPSRTQRSSSRSFRRPITPRPFRVIHLKRSSRALVAHLSPPCAKNMYRAVAAYCAVRRIGSPGFRFGPQLPATPGECNRSVFHNAKTPIWLAPKFPIIGATSATAPVSRPLRACAAPREAPARFKACRSRALRWLDHHIDSSRHLPIMWLQRIM